MRVDLPACLNSPCTNSAAPTGGFPFGRTCPGQRCDPLSQPEDAMSMIDDPAPDQPEAPLSFGKAFAMSDQFEDIFREGMALVETTASYLDGHGRREARNLNKPIAIVYATESMRLTTRLLEIASWLLVQRALKDGEITFEEAEGRRENVKLRASGRPSHIKHFDDLPEGLRILISRSFQLCERIVQIDRAMRADKSAAAAPAMNPVASQLSALRAAFTPSRKSA